MTTSLTRDGCVPRVLYTSDKRKGSSRSPPITGATQERRPIRVKHARGWGGRDHAHELCRYGTRRCIEWQRLAISSFENKIKYKVLFGLQRIS